MICYACGTDVEDDSAFCMICGADLSKIKCHECGTLNPQIANFCKKCRASLKNNTKDDISWDSFDSDEELLSEENTFDSTNNDISWDSFEYDDSDDNSFSEETSPGVLDIDADFEEFVSTKQEPAPVIADDEPELFRRIGENAVEIIGVTSYEDAVKVRNGKYSSYFQSFLDKYQESDHDKFCALINGAIFIIVFDQTWASQIEKIYLKQGITNISFYCSADFMHLYCMTLPSYGNKVTVYVPQSVKKWEGTTTQWKSLDTIIVNAEGSFSMDVISTGKERTLLNNLIINADNTELNIKANALDCCISGNNNKIWPHSYGNHRRLVIKGNNNIIGHTYRDFEFFECLGEDNVYDITEDYKMPIFSKLNKKNVDKLLKETKESYRDITPYIGTDGDTATYMNTYKLREEKFYYDNSRKKLLTADEYTNSEGENSSIEEYSCKKLLTVGELGLKSDYYTQLGNDALFIPRVYAEYGKYEKTVELGIDNNILGGRYGINFDDKVPYSEKNIGIIIENGTKKIADYAFFQQSSVDNIVIPESVEEIGACAFIEASITSLKISKNVRKICRGAFEACIKLAHVEFEDGIEVIDENGFASCCSFSELILPDTIKEIRRYAFCANFDHDYAMRDFLRISGINIEEYLPTLKNVTVKSGSIGEGAFKRQSAIENLVIGKKVIGIGPSAFEGCTSLKNIVFEEGFNGYINYKAFGDYDTSRINNCTIKLPRSLKAAKIDDLQFGKKCTLYIPSEMLTKTGKVPKKFEKFNTIIY